MTFKNIGWNAQSTERQEIQVVRLVILVGGMCHSTRELPQQTRKHTNYPHYEGTSIQVNYVKNAVATVWVEIYVFITINRKDYGSPTCM